MCLNGAAARLVQRGDKIIVISYADYDQSELAEYRASIVHVDDQNRALPALALD
jgi:aspartate 1-decarboxylase